MAMDKGAADAYVYAKASGMLSRSYVGKRVDRLFKVHSLSELWSLVSDKEVPAVPEALLARELEKEAQSVFINDYKNLVQNYSNPSPIFISLLHFYDYDNLKELGAALCMEEKVMPDVVDTSPYSLVDYKAWPDIKAMTKKGPVSWYDHVPSLREQQENDYKLDCQYIQEIWDSILELEGSVRKPIIDLVGENYRMINLLWALRLKIYYNMPSEQILDHLAYHNKADGKKDILAQDAIKILDWEVDDWEKWRTWKYASMLNPHEDGVVWNVDPRWIGSAFRKYHVEKAYRMFHLYPFTPCPLVCYFIIKRDELDNIRTASEGLRLHMESQEVTNG